MVKTPERVSSWTGPLVATRTLSPTWYSPWSAVARSSATWPAFGPLPSVKVYWGSLPSAPGAKLAPVLDQPLPISLPSGSATPAKPETRPWAAATPSIPWIFSSVAASMPVFSWSRWSA